MSFLCGGWSARDAVECADARPVDAASILCDDDDHWSGRPSDEPFRRERARPRASSARFDVSKLAPRAEEALPLLQWRDVDVDFGGARAVAGVSGALRCGGFVSVLGPSGAGKSTLLDVLTGRLRATRGSCLVLGRRHSAAAFRSVAAFVPQDDCFLPHLRTWEALYFVARLKLAGAGVRGALAATDALLATLGLAEKRAVFVGGTLSGGVVVRGLSGGQRRRLSLATGLVGDPRVFLIDEPTSGLDAASCLKVMGLLREFAFKTRMGVDAGVFLAWVPSRRAPRVGPPRSPFTRRCSAASTSRGPRSGSCWTRPTS